MRTIEQMEAHEQLYKTIDKQDALIEQLGEALRLSAALHDGNPLEVKAAVVAYEAWKAGRK